MGQQCGLWERVFFFIDSSSTVLASSHRDWQMQGREMRQCGERGKDKDEDRAKEMPRAKSTQEKNYTEKAKEMEAGEIP